MASLPGSALLAAQQQLRQRRAAQRQHRLAKGLPIHTDGHGSRSQAGKRVSTSPDPDHKTIQDISWQSLPHHLGWGNGRLTTLMRKRQATQPVDNSERFTARNDGQNGGVDSDTLIIVEAPAANAGARAETRRADIAISPDIALAIIRTKRSAAGRLWYLLRALDGQGKGWHDLAAVRPLVTTPSGQYRICGRRQLRNLLRQGDGLFWQLQADRLWLRRPARVAAALGLTKVVHRPVTLPLAKLLGPLKTVKAQLYAALHSARTPNHSNRNKPTCSAPIARQTIENLTGLSRQTQRQYEQLARVDSRRQFAIGPNPTPELCQELAWLRGNSLFTYRDRRGRFGQPDQSYLAWQLPNRYQGPHERLSRHRRRRLQRELTDLLTKGTTGNGLVVKEMTPAAFEPGKRYWAEVAAAVSSFAKPQDSCQPAANSQMGASSAPISLERSEKADSRQLTTANPLHYWHAEHSGYWFVYLGGK